MHHALLTPPSTPPPRNCPPSPESRIGSFLGESLQLKSILGTGAYGVVYSAVDLYTGNWYAVKALSKTTSTGQPLDKRQREFQAREIQLHYAASAHPNIVSMLKIVDDANCTYVVLEYCPEGDLFSNITEKGRYTNNDALVRRAFLQILDAVEHCHRLGIYHRDLKPENILVSNSGSDVLLADFGLATTDLESEDHGCGSTFYMSPECLDQRRPSYRCAPNDIWSLGVVLVNLACGRNPWKQASVEDSTYRAFLKDPNFLKTILPLSDDLNNILCRIFERQPEKRITIGELKQRIINCVSFSSNAPLTPPASPRSVAVFDEGSVMSDESLSDCSILSDDSDYDSGYDSASEPEPERKVETVNKPTHKAPHFIIHKPQVVRQAPLAPVTQHYVLPSQDFHRSHWSATPKVNTWHQHPGYSHLQPTQPHYVMPSNSHFYPVYHAHSSHPMDYVQFGQECW